MGMYINYKLTVKRVIYLNHLNEINTSSQQRNITGFDVESESKRMTRAE